MANDFLIISIFQVKGTWDAITKYQSLIQNLINNLGKALKDGMLLGILI
jgi:hypothetical protein